MVEQVAGAAADELDRAGRKDSGLDHHPENGLREVRREGRRLHDRGDAGEERWRQLLEHPPDREVEGVDMYGDALEWYAHVPSNKAAALGDDLRSAVDVERLVRKLA